ncbi:MAG TPA: type II toxin-antitoxin system prevent-host-death family antitoxin [Rhizomicrobium sp.]|nr:type II toxin-antitoxin system prevent-host-death family antitoxin [Rhizomicrobium sp.]
MDKVWPVQDAKARFSELLRAAEGEPQQISYRGEPKFEVRLIEERAAKKKKPKTLVDWWLSAPTVAEFKLPPRKREKPRKVF